MSNNPQRLSRRSFLENSTLAGLLGTAAVAAPTGLRAEPEKTSAPTIGASPTDLQRFGIKADGATDDTKAIQSALAATAKSGGICLLPAGQYRIDGALVVPAGVTLCGVSGGVPHSEHPIGTVLLAFGGRGNADGEPLITLKPNAIGRNLIIHYPEQKLPEAIAYPWSIRMDGELCQVLDITLTNPYQAIDIGSRWNEVHLVRNVFACPLKTGIYIDQCTDIGRIENVHFNPNFWTRMAFPGAASTGDIRAYVEKNLVGFKIGRTDWEFMSNCFVIFPKIGFHFNDFGHGPGNAVITQSGSDICPVAVRVDRTQPHAGTQWANGQFMGTIEIGEHNEGPFKLANCGFWGMETTEEQIRHTGPSTLMVSNCHFNQWDRLGKKAPSIRSSGQRIIINGCEFMDGGKPALRLEKGVKTAAVFGCAFRSKQAFENVSEGDVQAGLNTFA